MAGWAALRFALLVMLVAGLWYSSTTTQARLKAARGSLIDKAQHRDDDTLVDAAVEDGATAEVVDSGDQERQEPATDELPPASLPVIDADRALAKAALAAAAATNETRQQEPWAVRWLSPSDAFFSANATVAPPPGCPPPGTPCRLHHVFSEVLILTLPRRRRHWLRLSQQLRRRGVPHTLVHAYDGKAPGMRFMHRVIQSAREGAAPPLQPPTPQPPMADAAFTPVAAEVEAEAETEAEAEAEAEAEPERNSGRGRQRGRRRRKRRSSAGRRGGHRRLQQDAPQPAPATAATAGGSGAGSSSSARRPGSGGGWRSHGLALLATQVDVLDYLAQSGLDSVLVLQDSALLLEAERFDAEFDRQARLLPPDWAQFFLGASLELESWDAGSALTDPSQLEALEAAGTGGRLTRLLGVRRVGGTFAVAWRRSVARELVALAAGMSAPLDAAALSTIALRYEGRSVVAWPFLALPEPTARQRAEMPDIRDLEDRLRHWSYAHADVSDADPAVPPPAHVLASSPLDRWGRPDGSVLDLATDGEALAALLPPGAAAAVPSTSGGTVAVPLGDRGRKAGVAVRWQWAPDAPPMPVRASVVRPPGCPRDARKLCEPRHVFSEVVVITLPRRRDRWLRLSRQLARSGIEHTLVHGYHGRAAAWRAMDAAMGGVNAFEGEWEPAELALFATHLDVLAYTRRRKLASLLVLEDDALLLDDPTDPRAFLRAFDAQMRSGGVPRGWKLLYLGATLRDWDGRELLHGSRAFEAQAAAGVARPFPVRKAFGAFALAWSHAAAGQLMKKLQARPLPLDRSATAEVAEANEGRALVCWPFLVIPETRSSDLRQSTRHSRHVRYGGARWNASAHPARALDPEQPPPISVLIVEGGED